MELSRIDKYLYLIPHLLLATLLLGYLTEMPYLFMILFFIGHGTCNLLDLVLPRDPFTPYAIVKTMPENQGNIEYNWYYFTSQAYIYLYLVTLGFALYYAQFKQPTLAWMLYVIPLGITGQLALALCHEYMHTKYTYERIVARLVSCLSFWSVHEYEHLFIHHQENYICTDKDYSSAAINQNVYSYMAIWFIANYLDTWRIQKQISEREKKSFYNLFHNITLQTLLFSLLAAGSVLIFIGMKAFIFYMILAGLNITIYMITTYNQHYGLRRRKKPDGTYEPFTYMNIWNSNHRITSRYSFNASHHGHHHKFQFCRYQHLKVIENAPILPFGYFTVSLLCLIPPIWYKIMNKEVEKTLRLRDEYEKQGMPL